MSTHKHTPGPWLGRPHHDPVLIQGCDEVGLSIAFSCGGSEQRRDEFRANATLITAAPAMDLALQLISEGLARIERSGSLREFCFDGIRYVMNGDWNALIDVIGWDRARAAISKATGGAA